MGTSYIPFYRKYRPQQFKDLIGQEAISKTLSSAIELNKVAHAYLFTGPRGTGKTSTARIFAKSLNCEKGPTLEPCGVCPSCIDIASGSAIDVIEIDAASNRKVEDARNLLEKVQFVPVAGKFKVYIIDEVHMLTPEAFNTLLKTLEEPPANLVFILATTEAHKVLKTIISRCQRFDFRRIQQDLIIERLKNICKLENLNIDEGALTLIARRSSGGMRDALSLLDQVSILANIQEKIVAKDILSLLGCLQEDTLLKLVETVADKNSSGLLSILNEILELGNEPVQIIRELMNYFRNLMLIKTSENLEEIRPLIDVSDQFYSELKKQCDKFDVAEIPQIIEKLSEHEKILKTTSKQHLWLEVALISILHRQDIKVIKDLEQRITKLEEALSGGNVQISTPKITYPAAQPKPVSAPIPPAPKPVIQEATTTTVAKEAPVREVISENPSEPVNPQKEDVPAVQSADTGDLATSWANLLANIESIPTRTLFFDRAKPVELSANKIILNFANDTHLKLAQGKSKMAPFEKATQKVFGAVPNIVFRQGIAEKIELPKKAPDPVSPPPERKENFEQISQDFEEIPQKPASKVLVSEAPQPPIDEDVMEEINGIEKKVEQVNLPESAKMIKDLFQGKIID